MRACRYNLGHDKADVLTMSVGEHVCSLHDSAHAYIHTAGSSTLASEAASGEMASGEMASGEMASGEMASGDTSYDGSEEARTGENEVQSRRATCTRNNGPGWVQGLPSIFIPSSGYAWGREVVKAFLETAATHSRTAHSADMSSAVDDRFFWLSRRAPLVSTVDLPNELPQKASLDEMKSSQAAMAGQLPTCTAPLPPIVLDNCTRGWRLRIAEECANTSSFSPNISLYEAVAAFSQVQPRWHPTIPELFKSVRGQPRPGCSSTHNNPSCSSALQQVVDISAVDGLLGLEATAYITLWFDPSQGSVEMGEVDLVMSAHQLPALSVYARAGIVNALPASMQEAAGFLDLFELSALRLHWGSDDSDDPTSYFNVSFTSEVCSSQGRARFWHRVCSVSYLIHSCDMIISACTSRSTQSPLAGDLRRVVVRSATKCDRRAAAVEH